MLTGLRWIKFYQHVSQYHGLVIMSIHILTIKFGTLQISMFRMIRMDNLGIKSLFIYLYNHQGWYNSDIPWGYSASRTCGFEASTTFF